MRLRGVVAYADRFVVQRVERPADRLFGFDTVKTQQLGELPQGQLDALPELFG